MPGQRRRRHRIRGGDGYGRDRYLLVVADADDQTVTVHAPEPVQLDLHGAHKLSSAAGEGHWMLLTGQWPPDEPARDPRPSG